MDDKMNKTVAAFIEATKQQLEEIAAIAEEVEAAREKSRAETSAENTAEVKRLQALLSATITAGAQPCPDCGTAPIGMVHPTSIGTSEFEVGCPLCPPVDKDRERHYHAARKVAPMLAVESWNAGPKQWLRKRT